MTVAAPCILELQAGALRLALRPDIGGAIAGLWHGSTPVMRSTEPEALVTSRTSACYPLVPYSNRIGHRRFDWQGRSYTTEQNFDDNPHSVHGVAWQRAWDVVSSGPAEAVLRLRHTPDAHWPFAFEVMQHFVLTPEALTVRLQFTNTAPVAQPAGLGWHPYFPQRAHSALDIGLTSRWDSDAAGLPTRRVDQAGIHGPVAELGLDHCFEGWVGTAWLRDDVFALQLASSMTRLVVYTPRDKPYYCVEPVSHVSNAIQLDDPLLHGLRSVEPGGSIDGSMTLKVARV